MGRIRANDGSPAGGARDPWDHRAVPLALLLLVLLFLQGLAFLLESSQTSDEAAHLAAGYSYLETGDFRLNPEHPPLIKELAASPLLPLGLSFPWGPLWDQAEEWNIGRIFVHENRLSNDTILALARLPILMLSLVLGWALFHWGRRLFGARGALLSLGLYVFDPNVVAHSSLVTTDIGVTLFIFLAVYALWSWSERPSPRRLIAVGLAAGGAFASKFTALWLLPILALLGITLLALATPVPGRPWSRGSASAAGRRFSVNRIASLVAASALVAVIAFGVVAVSYGVRGLPAFLVGLDRGISHSGAGHMAYLMGRTSETGWWYYFLFAFLIKTPIGTLLVVGASIVALFAGWRRGLKDEIFLWVPILAVVVITCLWKVNIGLRHLLPIYPFLFLGAGRIAGLARPVGGTWARRVLPAAAAACLAWTAVEAAVILPCDLAYFNQLVGGPGNGHLYLIDSNLDWGQSSKAVRRFMEAERVPGVYLAFSGNTDPWYYGVRYQYVPGSGNLENASKRPFRMPEDAPRELFVISAMILHSVHFSDQNLYAWLRVRRPIATPGYSNLVYDITNDAETHSYFAVLGLNFGMLDRADFEARRALRIDPGNALAQAVLAKIAETVTPAPGGVPGPYRPPER